MKNTNIFHVNSRNRNPRNDAKLEKSLQDLAVARDYVYEKLRGYGLAKWECNSVMIYITEIEDAVYAITSRERDLFNGAKNESE